jgi:hypothetical protein
MTNTPFKFSSRRGFFTVMAALMAAVFAGFPTAEAQDSLQFFPQLVVAQDDVSPPTGGRRLHGPNADKIKGITRKNHVFEINALARKPVSVQMRKTTRVILSSDIILELEMLTEASVSVKIFDAKTRRVLKGQTISTNIPTNIIVGPNGEPQVVIVLTKGDKRPR